jgi:hypothetical protein
MPSKAQTRLIAQGKAYRRSVVCCRRVTPPPALLASLCIQAGMARQGKVIEDPFFALEVKIECRAECGALAVEAGPAAFNAILGDGQHLPAICAAWRASLDGQLRRKGLAEAGPLRL